MKIIFLLDQIQAGLGGKEHGDQPLGGQKTAIGSVKMFEKLLKEKNMEVLATIYCGDDYYRKHAKESSLKIAAMVQKLGADVLLCGPCFNYETYGEMAAEVAKVVEEKVQIPAVAAMSIECQEAITRFKDQVDIVKMPKKGGTGLTEAMNEMLTLCQLKAKKKDTTDYVKEHCY